MIRYHQPLLKPLNKLKIFREEIYQESISDERLTTRQETKTLYTFFSKKDFWKMKMDMTLPIIFVITPVDGLCYKVANSSIQQEFFSSVQNCSIIQCKKTLRVDKTRQKLRDKTTKK